jgi:hypothetical protein
MLPPHQPLQHLDCSAFGLVHPVLIGSQQKSLIWPSEHLPEQHTRGSAGQNCPAPKQTQTFWPSPSQMPEQQSSAVLQGLPFGEQAWQVVPPTHSNRSSQQKSFGAVPQILGKLQQMWSWQVSPPVQSALVQHSERWMHSAPHGL